MRSLAPSRAWLLARALLLPRAPVLTAVSLAFASPAATSATADEPLAERGRIIADTYCSECHATGASDNSSKPEAPPMRTFHERWPVEHLAEALAEGIMVGHEDMPEFRMTTSEIDALLTYLEHF